MTARWLMTSSRSVTVTIAANVYRPNIRALALAQGWDGGSPIELVVNAGVYVVALEIANVPHDVLTLTNRGTIGGAMGGITTGLYTRVRIRVANQGTIFGCGGLGGVGSSVSVCWGGACHSASGGSGGLGGGFWTPNSWTTINYQQQGSPGATGEVNSRPSSGYPGDNGSDLYGGDGGNGGAVGQVGEGGGSERAYGSYDWYNNTWPGPGGAAGNYLDGNAYVTWIATGTRLGNVV